MTGTIRRFLVAFGAAAVVLSLAKTGIGADGPGSPKKKVLVELYTSQG